MVTEDQMQEQRDKANDVKYELGTRWPGMSYEDGVIATLNWVLGDADDLPMEDE